MSASKLLAAGSSFSAARDVIGRYRMKSEFSPFKSATSRPGGSDECVNSAETTETSTGFMTRILDRLRPTRNVFRPSAADLAVEKEAGEEPSQSENSGAANSSARRPVRFENLRAVCNDLSDSDFEIVKRAGGGLLLRV